MNCLVKLVGITLLCLALGCETIAGIKDRSFNSEDEQGEGAAGTAGEPDTTEEQVERCESYCQGIMKECDGQYRTLSTCQKFCEALPLEGEDDNSLACREGQLRQKQLNGEPTCDAAGPTGDGECGATPCDVYCEVAEVVCGEERAKAPPPMGNGFEGNDGDSATRVAECKSQCKVLPPPASYDARFQVSGDTVECRFTQVAEAALDPTKCYATTVYPYYKQPGSEGKVESPCRNNENETEPDCDDYCRVVTFGCHELVADSQLLAHEEPGDKSHLVYADRGECEAVCEAAFEPGVFEQDDGNQNTIGCRLRHSYNVLPLGMGHCDHAGPGGLTVCHAGNGDCDGYCSLMAAGCEATFEDTATCLTSCRELSCRGCDEGDGPCPTACNTNKPITVENYAIEDAEAAGGLACMLRHATEAVEAKVALSRVGSAPNLASLCEAAAGGGACAP